MKLWLAWIFYGLFPHCTFEQYKVIKNFVGPPRKTLYQEMSEEIAKAKSDCEKRMVESKKRHEEFMKRHT